VYGLLYVNEQLFTYKWGTMTKIHWTEQEFNALAQALRQQFPDRAAAQAVTPKQFVFTAHEVVVVMHATFPRDRQRALTQGMVKKLTAKLIQAGGGVPSPPRQRQKPPNALVRWSPEEWRLYALSLMTLFPQLDLFNSPDLAQLRLGHLNKAGGMMAPDRQRTFNALGSPIVRLRVIYAEARRLGDPMFTGVRPPEAAAKPAAPAKLHPVITQTAPHAPSCKIFWTKTEWVKIAAELHRQYPHAKYPERNNLGALNAADVYSAQIVLPDERRRKNLKQVAMSMLRGPLIEAFKTVRAMQVEEGQQKMAVAQQAHSELLARAAAVAAEPNPWETAFKPFVDLLVREIGSQLLPALLEGLAKAAPPRPTPPAHLSLAPAVPARKVMRVGIVGNRSTYADDLERRFQSVEFECIESSKKIDSVRNCDKVIVLIKFVSHELAKHARRAAGERYVPINGSVTDMYRVIGGWLTDSAKEASVAAVG
jgi:hypothetical protein